MAPTKSTKGKAGAGKGSAKKPVSSKVTKAAGSAKGKKAGAAKARPTPQQQQKTSTANAKPANNNKKKKRVYTEKELNIPALNMITPAGVQKPKGKKKGKVFVDDQESMMTILAMVNADKEGQIESKMIKARQMEEIRQARQAEMEARAQMKKNKLEDTKKSLRKSSKPSDPPVDTPKKSTSKKRVSFG